ncbi:MAG: response regulator, partial [Treponema sp.]|jgi:signal transduction histidine kinase/ActR/RegA family two-component response regulator|nr:response regulator [Treponema sp.]
MLITILFFISLIFITITLYILGRLWFGDTKNRYLSSFFILGVVTALWIFFSGIASISSESFFPVFFTLKISTVALLPFSVLWVIINFTETNSFKTRPAGVLVWTFPVLDSLFILTNPLHYLIFQNYNYPAPSQNIGFWIHIGGISAAVFISFVILLRHAIKNARKKPWAFLIIASTLIPYILYMLYSAEIHLIPFDITPLGFFVVFFIFFLYFYKSRLFNFNALASEISNINEKNEKLKELTKAAHEASMAKSAFLANISHEIRTPLNAIIGMTHIAHKSAESEKNKKAIEEIEAASKHLLGLLNNVLDMSKIEAGKFELVHEVFPIKTVMNEVAAIIQDNCEINLVTDFNELKNYCVVGDSIRLKQVLINLLSNAKKFSPENGTIVFSIKKISECDNFIKLNFKVIDNGIGMTEKQMGKLFETFSQADSSIFNHFGGTGLGLSISQNLVQMMGGEITVKSKIKEGSSFEFTLNIEKAGKKTANEEVLKDEKPDLSGKRILIVEDIEINRAILTELLADTNAEFDEAVNGEEAVAKFNASKFYYYDLIFMDVQMPLLDGYEATRRIRSLGRSDAQNVPIIAMTANAYKEDIKKAFAAGMNGHLSKPVDINAMMKMLADKLSCNSAPPGCK